MEYSLDIANLYTHTQAVVPTKPSSVDDFWVRQWFQSQNIITTYSEFPSFILEYHQTL